MLFGLQLGVLLMLGSLFALTGLRQLFIHPLEDATTNLIWFAIQVLPLLVVIPGLLRFRPRSFFFATLISTMYFVHGVLLMVDPADRLMGLFEVGFSIILLGLSGYAVRVVNQ